jgi:hypothetical protein
MSGAVATVRKSRLNPLECREPAVPRLWASGQFRGLLPCEPVRESPAEFPDKQTQRQRSILARIHPPATARTTDMAAHYDGAAELPGNAGRGGVRLRVLRWSPVHSVKFAISHKNASFARKSTQMRSALFAVIPFSIGPRICAGISFGQQETSLWPPKTRTAAGQDCLQVGWALGRG